MMELVLTGMQIDFLSIVSLSLNYQEFGILFLSYHNLSKSSMVFPYTALSPRISAM